MKLQRKGVFTRKVLLEIAHLILDMVPYSVALDFLKFGQSPKLQDQLPCMPPSSGSEHDTASRKVHSVSLLLIGLDTINQEAERAGLTNNTEEHPCFILMDNLSFLYYPRALGVTDFFLVTERKTVDLLSYQQITQNRISVLTNIVLDAVNKAQTTKDILDAQ